MTIPTYIFNFLNKTQVNKKTFLFLINGPFYLFIYGILIIAFSYFYTSLVLNPDDMAKNLKKMGASIPGIRPGNQTSRHLKKILNRLTFLGSFFLFFVALIPSIVTQITEIKIFRY